MRFPELRVSLAHSATSIYAPAYWPIAEKQPSA